MSELSELATPAAIVDLDRVDGNLERMQRYCDDHGLALRPHVKTHKSVRLAEEQVRCGAVGITVATAVEAETLGPAAPELMLAYPPLGSRAAAAAASAEARPTLVALDSVEAVRALQAAVRARGAAASTIGVLVELDVGMRRCGVNDAGAAIDIARACDGDAVAYRGVMFYPGHIRERVHAQEAELELLGRTLDRFIRVLEDAGLAPAIVSGGSTPTAFRSHELPRVTEIRPGTYVFNDRTTCAIGACARDDLAYTVLATVVSTAVGGQAVVDAGSKALSSDSIRASGYDGFGELLDRPGVTVTRVSEEHGVLDLSRTDWRPRVGDTVRIVPNHVCVSVNLQTRIHGVRGERVVSEWQPDARGWS
ncbi:MAG TPA: alanine racemase [Longimicrobiales bacterium]|nr:alanine racemase [Longimicrobiales bacterium]